MGQYYRIVNIDKKEFMSPADFGYGLKLLEFADPMGQSMVTSAMALLMADGNNRGGGDLRTDHEVVGSWAYDRVAVVGDYADPYNGVEYYHEAGMDGRYRNVSRDIFTAMLDDTYIRNEVKKWIINLMQNKRTYWIPPVVIEMARDEDPILLDMFFGSMVKEIASVKYWKDRS